MILQRYSIRFLLISLYASFIYTTTAQIQERVYWTDPSIQPDKKGELSIEVDNLSFFKNNEYEGKFQTGWTLPGFWLQVKAVYYPLDNIKLEAGVHSMVYWGADKYPTYAYKDIAQWKSNSYHHGARVLPYLRAQVALSDNVNIILGDIYGKANHNLIEPLYSPELNLTADPEAGLQLLYTSRFVDLDSWVNWESFIFKNDYHQEAFTFGISSRVKFNDPESPLHVYMPVQALAQHRGGEIDTIYVNSVQTLMNGSIGAGVTWNTNRPLFKRMNAEVDMVGYYQQAGELWPFDNGSGVYARLSADIYDFRVKTSYWTCKEFISMFGSPFYGSVAMWEEGLTFERPKVIYIGAEYSRSFGKGYALGIEVDLYNSLSMYGNSPEGRVKIEGSKNFAAAIYLRINPSFLLKKF